MVDGFFSPRPSAAPTIHAFAGTHPDHAGLLKVGDAERDESSSPEWDLA